MNPRGSSDGAFAFILAALTAATAGCATAPAPRDNLDATLWVQTSAEYGAVARSVYATALESLSSLLADSAHGALLEQEGDVRGRPPAVILDVDETVLDNSPYQARLLVNGTAYRSDTWAAWVEERAAEAVPGALEFTNGAVALGVAVFYVTNRRAAQESATRDNLAALGFPLGAEPDAVLTRGERPDWGGTKSSRRRVVGGTHRVLMLVGDDLNDFVDVEGLSAEERAEVAESFRDYWGGPWYMLPNPTYGSWERALFGADYGLTPAERSNRKAEHLEPKDEYHE